MIQNIRNVEVFRYGPLQQDVFRVHRLLERKPPVVPRIDNQKNPQSICPCFPGMVSNRTVAFSSRSIFRLLTYPGFFALLGVYLFFLLSAIKLHFSLGVFLHFIIGADSITCLGFVLQLNLSMALPYSPPFYLPL